MSDPSAGAGWPASENDEYDPAFPLPANRLSGGTRRLVVALIILVIVFGIVASLTAIGIISRLERIERRQSLQEEVSTPPKQPDNGSSVEPVKPPKPPEPQQHQGDLRSDGAQIADTHESLVLDAARSYLASPTANAQTETEIDGETEIDRLRACLSIEDGSKERLDCYDSIVPPNPKPKPPVAKVVADCKFLKEEDERLGCFNRFLVQPKPPKTVQKAAPKTRPSK